MEYTTSIDKLTEQSFATPAVPSVLRNVAAGLNAPTWLMLIQAACCLIQVRVGHLNGWADTTTCVGVVAAMFGIYMGLRLCRQRSFARGLNCAAASMIALLFWVMQTFLREIPLFA